MLTSLGITPLDILMEHTYALGWFLQSSYDEEEFDSISMRQTKAGPPISSLVSPNS